MPHSLGMLLLLGGALQGAFLPSDAIEVRPYEPPSLEPEPEFSRARHAFVEITPPPGEFEVPVFARPRRSAPLVGHIVAGAKVALRGALEIESTVCASQLYFATKPFGWICADHAQPTDGPATAEAVLQVEPKTNLPYTYVMVLIEEGTLVPMWANVTDVLEGEPERQLARGDSVAIKEKIELEGKSYYITTDDKVIASAGTSMLGKRSDWHGVEITSFTHLPFAWVTRNRARVHDAPAGRVVDRLPRRTRLEVFEEKTAQGKRWLQIGTTRWINADHVGEVRRLPERPEATLQNRQWVDVDLGEQVVVAYEGQHPVFATLMSSGRAPHGTPQGNYPIWAKVSSITMKSQAYDDHPYYVDRVPWVLFFQAHNALHGAYWHDRFGRTKSHGCANLAPLDARYLFEWVGPTLPPGWSAVRFWDLTKAPVAHVHNSSLPEQAFAQERSVGPPDPTDEAARREAAEERRTALADESDALVDPGEGI